MSALPIPSAQWSKLPLALRQRWWRETRYGRDEPSPELVAELQRVHDAIKAREQANATR